VAVSKDGLQYRFVIPGTSWCRPGERREPHTIGVVVIGRCLGLIALTGLLPGELSRRERRRPRLIEFVPLVVPRSLS